MKMETVGLLSAFVWLGVFIMLIGVWYVGPGFDYHNEVTGHIKNAKAASTPELMEEELIQAREGMQHLGLTPEMYGVLFPWEKTPDNKMDYQYRRIDALVERANSVIEWREGQSGNESEDLNDVYAAKIQSLKDEIGSSDGIDHIAGGVFLVHQHFGWVILSGFIVALIILEYAFLLAVGVRRFNNEV